MSVNKEKYNTSRCRTITLRSIDAFNTLEHKVMYTKQIVHNGK